MSAYRLNNTNELLFSASCLNSTRLVQFSL